jgi:hypothetical protein
MHVSRLVRLVSIDCLSILFISLVYLYILYFVTRVSLLKRCRRKHRSALLRRILVLLVMLIVPVLVSSFILVRWLWIGSMPIETFKITCLFDTVGHTGVLATIFVSHTNIRRQHVNARQPLAASVRIGH